MQFISQEMADRIISYRDKKGGFRSLRHLSKVRGISRRTVDALRHYFTLDDASEHESNSSEKTSVTAPPDVGSIPAATTSAIAQGRFGHRRTHSVPLNMGVSPYLEASGDICELLALHSPRPVLEEVGCFFLDWSEACMGKVEWDSVHSFERLTITIFMMEKWHSLVAACTVYIICVFLKTLKS